MGQWAFLCLSATEGISLGFGERSSGKETQDNAQDKHKAYKVVAEHIELRNPNWAKTVQHAVGKAAEQLGIIGDQPSIRADLRHMLLCESGNFEKSCQDMMDEKGLVAKLIIVLPSAYEGGDTVVQIAKGSRKADRHRFLPITRRPSTASSRIGRRMLLTVRISRLCTCLTTTIRKAMLLWSR